MNYKELLPHVYFILAFIMAFAAIEQAIPFADQYGSYAAVIMWVFLFGFYFSWKNRSEKKKLLFDE